MYGAIIGDLAGSIYEYDEFNDGLKGEINLERRLSIFKQKEIIKPNSFYSDDTILTIAILDAIINNCSYRQKLIEYGQKYGKETNKKNYFKYMFSPGFLKWVNGEKEGNSTGNGCCMRIGPIGYLFNNLEKIYLEAKMATATSHNNYKSIMGAQAIVTTIFLSRANKSKEEIIKFLTNNFNYNLTNNLIYLQRNNLFNGDVELTVNLCLYIFLISNSFEDAIRKAISIGGDTDTIACIVGSMAEAFYGIPQYLLAEVKKKLPNEFNEIIETGYSKVKKI